jgi:Zn-finger nucleic acid-binding protein
MDKEQLFCDRCDIALEPRKTHFTYLGHAFQTELPRCPKCGQVYIDEEFAKGRMAHVEMELEDK